MKYVLKNQEMKQVDQETIESIGIPGLVLMERASLAVANRIREVASKDMRILAVAGYGNNGGDALAITRILMEDDYDVDFMMVGNPQHGTKDVKTQLAILEKLGKKPMEQVAYHQYGLIIDGIFGVGLSREVQGEYAQVIKDMNASKAYIVSVDIASGVSGDTGKVMGCSVKADETVTFGGLKRGHLLYPGRKVSGKVTIASIGFFSDTLTQYASGFTYDEDDLKRLPERFPDSNKGSYGKVLVIAGKKNMAGAACFAGKAAYQMGSGLVQICSHEENREIIQINVPEAIYTPFSCWKEQLSWCDVIVFGPGLGVSKETKEMLEGILNEAKVPILIDADGLNTIAHYRMELHAPYGIVMTPHLMEGARLLGMSIDEVKEDVPGVAQQIADRYHCVAVLKDATTIVATPNDSLYMNQSGNHGMSTGGTGDVLSGVIGSLMGAGLSLKIAACLGVYIHGLAGDQAALTKGSTSLIASDVVDAIYRVVGGLKGE